ncbi:MAG: DnaA/Hda family protein [candidate division WOR-3 bacterium]
MLPPNYLSGKGLGGLESRRVGILYFGAMSILPRVLSLIRETVSPQIYETWFSAIRDITVEAGVAVVTVPDQFFADWLSARHLQALTEAIAKATGERLVIEFRVAEPRPLPDRGDRQRQSPGLIPRFTLAAFLILSHNRFPCAAIKRFIENDGGGILTLVGPPGAGKTHLANAAGHLCLSLNPHAKVRYARAEPFFNSLLSSIREKSVGAFKKSFRNLDLLILDDFQFVKGKTLLMEELIHMIDSLLLKDKKVIVVSGIHPKELGLSESLLSRLMGGLLVEISEPGPKDRERFLRTTLEAKGIPVEPEVITHVAQNCRGAMRELEGVVQRLWAYHSLVGGPIGVESAKAILADMMVIRTPAQIAIERVIDFMGVSRSELLSGSRRRRVSLARHLIAYILREDLGLPLEEAAEALGGIHHTAILYATNRVRSDPKLLSLARKLWGEIREQRSSE